MKWSPGNQCKMKSFKTECYAWLSDYFMSQKFFSKQLFSTLMDVNISTTKNYSDHYVKSTKFTKCLYVNWNNCNALKLQSTFLKLSGKYFEVSLFFILPLLFGYQWHFLINVMTTIITSFIHSYNNIGVSDTYLIFPLFRGDYKLNLLFNGVFISFPDRSQDNYTINKNEHGRVFLLLAHNVNCFSVYVQSSGVSIILD